jgi:site-specific DNA-methyltransferase (adenine-specific)
MRLYKGDCLEVMKTIESGSIDAIITDPPYGTTACKWDSVIDFKLMWEQLNRIIKPNGAIVLFSKQPFTSVLNCSNIKNYKQELIWQKDNVDNSMQAKRRFLNTIENISIFYMKPPTYNPQGLVDCIITKKQDSGTLVNANGINKNKKYIQSKTNYPKNILKFNIERAKDRKHPTQKPIKLMEYLIKTYTNENETVLDFTMGSGSTGVAAKNLNRNFIGIEQDDKYFEIATKRINDEQL